MQSRATTAQGRKAKESGKDDSPHNDCGNDMKKTTVPKREKETIAVSEFISKLNLGKEVSGTKYVRLDIISILASIELELIDPVAAEEKRKKREREMMTDDGMVVSTMVNNIFDTEKNKMNGMNVDENDDMDDDVVDDDDSVENGKVVDQKGPDLTDENEDCDASINGIVHEDDDIMREEDDAFLLSDE